MDSRDPQQPDSRPQLNYAAPRPKRPVVKRFLFWGVGLSLAHVCAILLITLWEDAYGLPDGVGQAAEWVLLPLWELYLRAILAGMAVGGVSRWLLLISNSVLWGFALAAVVVAWGRRRARGR
ncbi:MAG TPA: hypothetical protein VEA69_20565 [Tepidisphaeraceae bacterium]|nr:hypothetical protein [Tepidisphaeraceae bacterium]